MFVIITKTGGGDYRVWGPVNTKSDAVAMKSRLEANGAKYDIFIREVYSAAMLMGRIDK